MKIYDLFEGIEILKTNTSLQLEVTNIVNDSRKAKADDIFVAIKGFKRDGNDYIESAVLNGVSAVVTDEFSACNNGYPYILVENVKAALAKMWSNFYGNPTKAIKIVAITGTNGKTTTACILNNILNDAGISTGLVSTIGCFINGRQIDIEKTDTVIDICGAMTTPDPEILYYILNIMKENNVRVVVMEASSHALDQHRLDGLEVSVGCFTNLSEEHLDYHSTMEEYFETKKLLIEKSQKMLVNIDDKYGEKIAKEKRGEKILGLSVKDNPGFKIKNVLCSASGSNYTLEFENSSIDIFTPLIGEFNVYNSALASACAVLLEIDKETITNSIKKTASIRGRLEKYRDKEIYIDYAHTPEAFRNVLTTIKELKRRKIIALFGCGGNRDKSKRGEMGRICSKYADFTIVTSDNPRNEDADDIISDIVKGIEKGKNYCVVKNRREAIWLLSKLVTENHVAILLGKGHEEYEIYKCEKRHFSEREILDEVFLID